MLKRVDKFEFGIHETIYSNVDLELSFSWKKQTVDKIGYDNHFWIFKDDKRIGGVHISPNFIGAFFIEAPYAVERFIVISALNNALLQWKDKDNKIMTYGIIPKDIEHFHKLGYRIKCERRVMIRPTEIFSNINWGEDLIIKVPTISDVPEIGNPSEGVYHKIGFFSGVKFTDMYLK